MKIKKLATSHSLETKLFPRQLSTINAYHSKDGYKIFMFGGQRNSVFMDDFLVLNVETLEWKPLPPFPFARALHTSEIVGNTLYIYGGVTLKTLESEEMDSSIYSFNIIDNTWSEIIMENGFSGRYGHSCNEINGNLVFFGGASSDGLYDDLLLFDISEYHFISIKCNSANCPSPRYLHSSAVYKNELYICGGYDGNQILNELWIFNFVSRKWRSVDFEGEIPLTCSASVLGNDILYFFGGKGEFSSSSSRICYLNSGPPYHLEELSELTEFNAIHGIAACLIEGRVFLIGGDSDDEPCEDLCDLVSIDINENDNKHENISNLRDMVHNLTKELQESCGILDIYNEKILNLSAENAELKAKVERLCKGFLQDKIEELENKFISLQTHVYSSN
jgi:N-acetylneuraminic acid mutarotase